MSIENDLVEALVAGSDRFPRMDKKTVTRMREDVVHATMRGIVPRALRIDVPLLNQMLLRETGNILAGLGQRLMALTHEKHLDEEHKLSQAVYLVREAQSRILYLRGGKSAIQKMLDARLVQDTGDSD